MSSGLYLLLVHGNATLSAVACRHAVVQREVKDLEKGIAHLHNCMARYNALIADSAMRKVQLVNDNFHLETRIGHELKVCLVICVPLIPCMPLIQYLTHKQLPA